jgi:hypothetical protein
LHSINRLIAANVSAAVPDIFKTKILSIVVSLFVFVVLMLQPIIAES